MDLTTVASLLLIALVPAIAFNIFVFLAGLAKAQGDYSLSNCYSVLASIFGVGTLIVCFLILFTI